LLTVLAAGLSVAAVMNFLLPKYPDSLGTAFL
jgi:hypothetical protein